MASLNAARVDALLKERYRQAVPQFYEQAKTFCSKLKKREEAGENRQAKASRKPAFNQAKASRQARASRQAKASG